MDKKERQQSWSEFLDKEKKNLLLVRYVFDQSFREVEEFAVIYLTILEEKPVEVVRYDCSSKETAHIHTFYSKPPEKKYLKKEKSFETLEEFISSIKKNWRQYRVKFLEK